MPALAHKRAAMKEEYAVLLKDCQDPSKFVASQPRLKELAALLKSSEDATIVKKFTAVFEDALAENCWEEYKNLDMSGQGDVDIIHDWKTKHSIDDLKRIAVEKGYSAFSVSVGESQSFGHCAFKNFGY